MQPLPKCWSTAALRTCFKPVMVLPRSQVSALAVVSCDTEKPSEVDVVVVGGGIAGVSTALALAERNIRVCLCEKGRIAGEQSSRNWGWVRQMGRDPAEMPLAIESLKIWRSFERNYGIETGFRSTGICYLCRTAGEKAKVEKWAKTGEAFGLEQHVLGSSRIARLLPASTKEFTLGLHTPTDGRAEPSLAVPALAGKARELGAVLLEGCAVRGFETAGGKVSDAVTEHGNIRCDAIVVAGGAWTRLFLGNVGVPFPQLRILSTAARADGVENAPEMPVGGGDFAFRRRLDGGFTIALRNTNIAPLVPDSVRLFADFLPAVKRHWRELRFEIGSEFVTELRTPRRWSVDESTPFEARRTLDPTPRVSLNHKALVALRRAFPSFASARITHSWAGLIDTTPDELPVLDRVDRYPGLFVASGFSGHGFGTGPAAGLLMAQLVNCESPCVDPRPFSLSRFGPSRREAGE